MKFDERPCPQCAEVIKKAAAKCKHCGSSVASTAQTPAAAAETAGGCIGLLILIAIVFGLFRACSGPDKSPEQAAADVQASAEERRKGFHCLSAWDGSQDGVVRAVKAQLREPDSFEHIETRIGPVDGDGEHAVLMSYRARNGFGGMNVGSASAKVSQIGCVASDVVFDDQ